MHWIKFPSFYHNDQISLHHHKKFSPAPLTVITGGGTGETSQFEKYFALSE